MNLKLNWLVFAAILALVCITVNADEPKDGWDMVDVELSEGEHLNLLAAQQVFLNAEPSETLAKALTEGAVRVRADRKANWESPVVQGWIYYSEIDGVRPLVLCLSQSGPIIDWMWCQDETDYRQRWTDDEQRAQVPTERPSIAVLRFISTEDDDITDLADQLVELLTNRLADDSGLLVASKTSSWRITSSDLNVRDAVRDLGVRYWIEGGVRGDRERIHVTVQLIDAETEMHLWSETYSRKRGESWDLWELPKTISEAIRFELDFSKTRTAKSN